MPSCSIGFRPSAAIGRSQIVGVLSERDLLEATGWLHPRQREVLELEIGYGLINLVDEDQGGDLLKRVSMIRRQIALDQFERLAHLLQIDSALGIDIKGGQSITPVLEMVAGS